jgi:hypothetical protein
MPPREVECTLRFVIKEQCPPRNRRMTDSAPRFVIPRELSEMHVLVARLTFRWDPLILDTPHSRHDLFLMTIRTSNGKMFSKKLKLGRTVVESHRFPVRHCMTTCTAEICHEPVELPVVLVGMTCFAADSGKSEHRFRLSRFSVTVNARHSGMSTIQGESRVIVLCHGKFRRLVAILGMTQCAVIYILPGELSLMVVGMAIGASAVGQQKSSGERLPLRRLLVAFFALESTVLADQFISSQIVIKRARNRR